MSVEMIRIYDDQKQPLGITSRDMVHQQGYWHNTFHCWFVKSENITNYIYFQLRSKYKKDFPNLFDITAAGHILADETILEGVREIKEELGFDVSIDELEPLGEIRDCIITGSFIDKEFANVYIHRLNDEPQFQLQKDEVSGIVRAEFEHFYELVFNIKNDISITGFVINDSEEKIEITKRVSKNDFVPHSESYLKDVVSSIKKNLKS